MQVGVPKGIIEAYKLILDGGYQLVGYHYRYPLTRQGKVIYRQAIKLAREFEQALTTKPKTIVHWQVLDD